MINPTPWVTRAHPGPRAQRRELSPEQREAAEAALLPDKAEARVVRRAQALLLMADGVGAGDIAKILGVRVRTVFKWRKRFKVTDPIAKLTDAPRSGRPASLSPKRTLRGS